MSSTLNSLEEKHAYWRRVDLAGNDVPCNNCGLSLTNRWVSGTGRILNPSLPRQPLAGAVSWVCAKCGLRARPGPYEFVEIE